MNRSIIWLGIGLLFFGAFVIFLVNEIREPSTIIVEAAPYEIIEPELMEFQEIPLQSRAMRIGESIDTVTVYVHRIDTVYVHKVDTVYVNKVDLDRIFDGLDRIFGSIEMLLSLMASGLAFYKFMDSRKSKD